jgi:hypothetical protein
MSNPFPVLGFRTRQIVQASYDLSKPALSSKLKEKEALIKQTSIYINNI